MTTASIPEAPTTYEEIARNMLAAALFNMRHVREDQRLVTWDEICRDDLRRRLYLSLADRAMRLTWRD